MFTTYAAHVGSVNALMISDFLKLGSLSVMLQLTDISQFYSHHNHFLYVDDHTDWSVSMCLLTIEGTMHATLC